MTSIAPDPTCDDAVSGVPAPSLDDDASVRVLRQFRIVFNTVKAHFRQVERDTGIGGAQLWALSEIRATPGIGVNDLARALDVHQSTASNLVKSLLDKGLVMAVRSGRDRRIVLLSLLPAGAALLDSAPAPFAGVLPGALAGLDLATLNRLETDLASVIALLQGDPAGAKVPLAEP
ncbi:MarR family winged helix-turn-helix transcriptional regulator [Massilia soli]|uniref:MarR family winged helix-turn-helix transcriptional regulator n=1 Tax=Massilia soli TaxID=2792854 RepID=A0ABS7SUZ6_9BURK|nr:MarR family winged helix-turn-helix transcriptional regulator [Massilia soli]MBZ2209755.1 MarR family winged helix-turn-helix transcriptional regulator [Massilia soli]